MRKGTHHSEESRRLLSEYRGERNSQFGTHKSEETKQKIGNKISGELNGSWKGDNVKYASLHEWIKNHKIKPKFCEECNKEKPYDLANISGKYKRDINDFRWLCRRCHMKSDGRIKSVIKRLNKYSQDRIKKTIKYNKENSIRCPLCKSFRVVKRGFINGKIQRFGCQKCGVRFS